MTVDEKEKDRIITELFNSQKVHHQVTKICKKNKIHPDTFIAEDIVSETFYHLSRTKATKLIAIYNQGELNILGYASTIAIRKGVLSDSKNPDYHKHSVAKNILYASNLKISNVVIADTDEDFLIDPFQEDASEEVWRQIKKKLTKTDLLFLNSILINKKQRGRYKNNIKIKRIKLFSKIKEIVIQNKIEA